jgi:hypothetical protein
LDRIGIELLEVIRGIVQVVAPVKAEPTHVCLNRFDVLDVFSGGIGIIEPQMTHTAGIFRRHAEVEANGFGVSDVQITVGLRREAGDDAPMMFVGSEVFGNNAANKVR